MFVAIATVMLQLIVVKNKLGGKFKTAESYRIARQIRFTSNIPK